MKKLLLTCLILLVSNHLWAQQRLELPISNGVLSYSIFGTGQPVLLLNGGPGMSSKGFRSLAKMVSDSANVQVILFDQRGTGNSNLKEINENTISMDLMLDDMEALRKHLSLNSWILYGHSFGGMLAYSYTAKYPKRVKAMIQSSSGGMDLSLFQPGGSRITDTLTPLQRDSLNYWTSIYSSDNSNHEARLKRAYYLAFGYITDLNHHKIISERLTQGNSRINSLMWQDMRRLPYNVTDQMKSFTGKVLILHGDVDIVPLRIAEASHEILKNSKLVWLKDVRHYGWLDAKDQYFAEVFSFLKNL